MELFNKVTAGRLALPEKVRVNLLALGDVGSTLLLGLRLMGGDVISSMGICDVRENAALRRGPAAGGDHLAGAAV